MIQLLIVDDEPLVQIGIRSMLDWESLGIEIAGTATNGQQAYDIILEKQPEIVMTDIKMPIMGGMELIEKCQQEMQHPPLFILLTSYEEFNLVKQAISYQVLDYLVKLELTEELLLATIQKALGIVEKEKQQNLSTEAPSDLTILQDNFYIRLLLNLFENEDHFRAQCDLLSISFKSAGYAVSYLEMKNTRHSASNARTDDITLYQSTYEMMKNLIVKYLPCKILFLDTTHFAILFKFEKEQLSNWETLILDALKQTCHMLYNYYSIDVLASVGSLVENPHDISSSYSDARQIFDEVLHTEHHIIFMSDECLAHEGHNVFNIAIFKEDLQKAFNEYDSDSLSTVLNDIIDLFHNDNHHYSQALSAASNVLHLTLSCLNNGESQLNQIFHDSGMGYDSLYEAENTQQILEWLTTLRDGLCALFSEHNKDYKNRTISAVKKYINEHVDEKISLNQMADIFNISPNYLSILFSKYNDMGFNDYINHAKIECAKELLQDGTLKIYEISDKLGYESAFYFSRVFKKIEGVSPREYINQTSPDV